MTDPDPASPAARWMGQFGAAWCLLTRLPWPGSLVAGPRDIGRGAWAFPLVGAVVGAIGGGSYWLAFALGLPGLAASGLALTLMALATGALHEDGLADTADGFGGGRTRDRKLDIMRDSRIGTYGVVALVLMVVLRLAALAAMPPAAALAATIAAAALARASGTLPMCLLPPARADGLGRSAGRTPALAAAVALILGIGIAFAASLIAPLPLRALGFAIAAAFAATAAVSLLALRQIGGSTGDVLGAAILSAETAALLAFAAR